VIKRVGVEKVFVILRVELFRSGVQATAARLSQESAAAREMITRSTERRGRFLPNSAVT
jgi:hypothetical protein